MGLGAVEAAKSGMLRRYVGVLFAVVFALLSACGTDPEGVSDADADGFSVEDGDCDDTDARVNPVATEVCNGLDENCDGTSDEGVTSTYFADLDQDGFGSDETRVESCALPSESYVSQSGDCNDFSADIFPSAIEVCNDADDNCDGLIDEADPEVADASTWHPDVDGDSYGDRDISTLLCALIPGYVADASDCNDAAPDVHPNAIENAQNLLDDDCDGLIDEIQVIQVATGIAHSIGLRSDGTVVAWGSNDSGQLGLSSLAISPMAEEVSALPTTVAVAAGHEFSLALAADGSVWSWGNNQKGQLGDGTKSSRSTPEPIEGLAGVVAIAAGANHALAIVEGESGGEIWVWGENTFGQLGDGSKVTRVSPVQLTSLTAVIDIAAGDNFSVALVDDGSGITGPVYSWGDNSSGQLGNGTNTASLNPLLVPSLEQVTGLRSGGEHTLVLKGEKAGGSGELYAWGRNNRGQLGDGTTENRNSPVKVDELGYVISFSAGDAHSAAVRAQDGAGDIWTWGNNDMGQLGDGTNVTRTSPVKIESSEAVTIACGTAFTLAALPIVDGAEGGVLAWGDNTYGQLGDGNATTNPAPTPVAASAVLEHLGAGKYHSLATGIDSADGINKVWAWGDNAYGQLGNASYVDSNVPVVVSDLVDVTMLEGGQFHSIGLRSDGTVWAWGWNFFGQVGDGTRSNRNMPVQTAGLDGVVAVDAGFDFSMALRRNDQNIGEVWTWGNNTYGQLGDGTSSTHDTPIQVTTLGSVLAIAAGDYHGMAIVDDGSGQSGTIWAWGYNYNGQLGNGTTTVQRTPVAITSLQQVEQIVAGGDHSMALVYDSTNNVDTIWSWGGNSDGQVGDGTYGKKTSPVQVLTLADAVKMSAGMEHSLVAGVLEDGSSILWAWGSNAYGQLGDGTYSGRTVPGQILDHASLFDIVAGGYHTLEVNNADDSWTVQAWGWNGTGQLGTGARVVYNTPTEVLNLP